MKSSRILSVLLSSLMLLTVFSVLLTSFPGASGAAVVDTGNYGHQDLLTDPVRPWVYHGVNGTKYLHIYEYTTGNTNQIHIGDDLRALDLSLDDHYLAIASSRKVVIFDLETLTISSSYPLDFEPRSLSYGHGDKLFVSDMSSGLVQVLDPDTGALISSFNDGTSVILEADKNSDMLLTFSLGIEQNVEASKYSTAGITPSFLGSTSDMGSYFSQAAVDWQGGSAYVVCSAPSEIQVLSISTLEKKEPFLLSDYPVGVALSLDQHIVYGVCSHGSYPEGTSATYVYELGNRSLFNIKYSPPWENVGGIAPLGVYNMVVLGTPEYMGLLDLSATIEPIAPVQWSTYASTPSYILFKVNSGMTVPADDVFVSIDDGPMGHPVASGDNRFQYNINSPLSIGGHKVTVSAAYGTAREEWSFDIGSGADLAPYLTLISPTDGQVLDQTPSQVRVALTDSNPPSQNPFVTISYDGTALQTYRDNQTGEYYALVPSGPVPYRTVPIVGEIHVDGRVISKEWTITVGSLTPQAPDIFPTYPQPGAEYSSPPGYIAANLFLGVPSAIVYTDSIEVTIDNIATAGQLVDGNTIIANITSPLAAGPHHVIVSVDISSGHLSEDWYFTYVAAQEYNFVRVQYGEEYSILAPDSWTVTMDKTTNGYHFDIVIVGPEVNGVSQNVNMQSGTDNSVSYNYSFYCDYINSTLDELAAQMYSVSLVGTLNYTIVSDLTAGIWQIQWNGFDIKQAQALIADRESGRYWVFTCTSSESDFDSIWPVFEKMINSLDVTGNDDEGPVPPSYDPYERPGDYSLLVPGGWTIEEEYTYGGSTFSLRLIGPRVDDFTVNILLQNGTDGSLSEDHSYLSKQVNDRFIDVLKGQGVDATIYEQPTFSTISNHTAITFSIKWSSAPIIQKVVLIVDSAHHRYWAFICSASEGNYSDYSEIFDTVTGSLNVTASGNQDISFFGGETILLIAGAVAVAVVATIVAVAVLRRKGQ